MMKSEKGKEVSTLKPASTIAQSLTDQSKIPKSELPQDPAKGSLGSEFPVLSHPRNTTSVTSSTATNTNTNAGASSSNTSQEPQMGVSASNAGTSGDSGAGDIGVDGAGTAGGAGTFAHWVPPWYDLIDTTHQETDYICSMVTGFFGVLFTGSDSSLVREWRKGKGHASARFKSSCGPINAIVFQYPEARIFCAHDDGAIRVWESDITREGVFKPIKTLQTLSDLIMNSISLTRSKAVSCLCLSDNCDFIYSGSVDHTVNVWHIRGSWKHVETIKGHKGAINALAMGPGVVISSSSDHTVKLWKREQYGEKGDKVKHILEKMFFVSDAVVNALILGIDLFMYAGLSNGNVMCWRLLSEDDKPEVMSFHKGAVTCLALCSGPFVFSGSADMTICVWKRENKGMSHKSVMVLRGHSAPVRCIETQRDWEKDATGARRWVLYSGSLDRTLKVWRVYERPPSRRTALKSRHREEFELRRTRSF